MITVYHDGSAASSPFLDLRKRRRKDIVLGTSSNHRLRSMDWQPSTLCHKGRSRNVPRRILLITEYTGYRNIRSGQLLLGGRAARAPRTCLLMDMEWLRSGLLHAMANSASLALVPPMTISPIIPVLRKDPFDDPAYLFELKLDDFRGLADSIQGRMLSKNGNPLKRFEGLLDALHPEYVCDGESVALDGDGRGSTTCCSAAGSRSTSPSTCWSWTVR